MPRIDHLALRRGVLAVSVLHDVDVEPRDDGFLLPGRGPVRDVLVTWADLAQTCGPDDPSGVAGGHRLAGLLRLARAVAVLGPQAATALRSATVLLALPAGHLDHLGPAWAVEPLRGGALDLGVGVRGLLDDPAAGPAVPLPPALARLVGVDPRDWWPAIRAGADRRAALAVEQLGRDGRAAGQVRPVDGCDVLALLAGSRLRAALAASDGTGMRALAAPTRTRGWYDLARVDPAYVGAVWSLTAPALRGVDRPLLVTRDEVALVHPRDGARQLAQDLARHAVDERLSPRRPGSPSTAPAVPQPRPPGD